MSTFLGPHYSLPSHRGAGDCVFSRLKPLVLYSQRPPPRTAVANRTPLGHQGRPRPESSNECWHMCCVIFNTYIIFLEWLNIGSTSGMNFLLLVSTRCPVTWPFWGSIYNFQTGLLNRNYPTMHHGISFLSPHVCYCSPRLMIKPQIIMNNMYIWYVYIYRCI